MIKINDTIVVPTIFPDQTTQVWKIIRNGLNDIVNCIKWEFSSESEFIHVAQLVDLVKELKPTTRLNLIVPYFPYARQDKEISNESTFALRTFCKLLNTLYLNEIITYDLHSEVPLGLLPNLISVYPGTAIERAISNTNSEIVIYPDKGAFLRYSDLIELPSIYLEKTRNQLTSELQFKGSQSNLETVTGKNIIIIDDICDGGGTFILASKLLNEHNPTSINLYTTHGIYSKGLTVLRKCGINRIFNLTGEV